MAHRSQKNAVDLTISQVRLLTDAQARATELHALLTAATQILGAGELPSMLATILDNVIRLSTADDASVWLLQETGGNLRLELARGSSTNTPQPGILVNQGLAGDALETGKVVNVSDCRLSQPVIGWNVDCVGARSAIVIPLKVRDQQLGVLVAWSGKLDHFDVACEETLVTLAEFGAVGIAQSREVAARVTLEQQLLQSHKMEAIGRLAGGVAHDFNNLLTTISGFGELALLRLPTINPVREYVEEIIQAGDRAAALTRQLLAFSRSQPVEPRVLDLNAVVTETERMLRRLVREDIELATRLDPALGQVKADPGQIQQIVMNLVVNARDAIPGAGRLTIETANVELDGRNTHSQLTARPGSYVMLSVTDTGSGMDPDTLSHIFEPFFTTKSPGLGIGLGLSTVYGIVKQSGGDIVVDSEVGQGTTFKIFLPRVKPVVDFARAPQVLTKLPRGTEMVLVVEDEERLRGLARLVLQAAGYKVLEASRGDVALQIAEDQKGAIDLVLTDMVMPGLSGRQVADQLRTSFPRVKVLFMSGYSDDVILRNGMVRGDVAFLAKPFSPNDLTRKVREVLDKVEATG